jgi:hypothetical protein
VGLILRGHGLAQYEAVMNLRSQLGHALDGPESSNEFS